MTNANAAREWVIECLGTAAVESHFVAASTNHEALDDFGIRTDYRFASVQEAVELTRFFFGDELADRVRVEDWLVLPENTGIWWRRSV